MGKEQGGPRLATLQLEEDARAIPLIAGLTSPIGQRGRVIHLELKTIDGIALEKAQGDGAFAFGDVCCPPLGKALSCRDQGIDGLRLRCNLNSVANIWHGAISAMNVNPGSWPPVDSP